MRRSGKIAVREFIGELKARLDSLSREELKEILLHYAKSLPSGERRPFLDVFERPAEKKGAKPKETDVDGLLAEIEAFQERLAEYHYCNGYGWDHEIGEERTFGDESWAFEVDAFFDEIGALYEARDFAGARRAFEALFEVYQGGLEEGQLAGSDPEEMLQTDLDEAELKYLRCIYLTEKPPDRPKALFDALSDRFGAGGIRGMIDVDTGELPDLDRFGRDWQAFLKKQGKKGGVSVLLREAARLFEDEEGLKKMALESGRRFPGLFLDWMGALEKKEKHRETVEAALYALEKLPEDLEIRAPIADGLRKASRALNRKKLILRSLKEAVFAAPSLVRLLDYLDAARNAGERAAFLDDLLARFEALRKKSDRSGGVEFGPEDDLSETFVPDRLETLCRFLRGDYAGVAALMGRSGPAGWYFGNDPIPLVVPLFLYARWNMKKPLAPNLAELLKDAVTEVYDFCGSEGYMDDGRDFSAGGDRSRSDPGDRLRNLIDKTLVEMPIPGEEKILFFRKALGTVDKRVDSIVGGKHRKSYWEAARLIAAAAEVYRSNGEPEKGRELVGKYMHKYRRFYAFKRELSTAAEKSKVCAS